MRRSWPGWRGTRCSPPRRGSATPQQALGRFGPLLDTWLGMGSWTQLWIAVRALAEALSRLGHHATPPFCSGAMRASPRATTAYGADSARVAGCRGRRCHSARARVRACRRPGRRARRHRRDRARPFAGRRHGPGARIVLTAGPAAAPGTLRNATTLSRVVWRVRATSGAPLPPAASGVRVRSAGEAQARPAYHGSSLVAPHDVDTRRPHQHRDAHQRPHPRSRGPTGRAERGTGRHRAHRGRPAARAGGRARPRRGRGPGPAAGLQAHGLRQVQVRERAEGPGVPPQPAAHHDQGAEAPTEDRQARLRDEARARQALPRRRQQGQGHDHVPWSRAVPARAGLPAAAAAGRGRERPRYGRGRAQAGRAQHDDGDRSEQEAAPPASPAAAPRPSRATRSCGTRRTQQRRPPCRGRHR